MNSAYTGVLVTMCSVLPTSHTQVLGKSLLHADRVSARGRQPSLKMPAMYLPVFRRIVDKPQVTVDIDRE